VAAPCFNWSAGAGKGDLDQENIEKNIIQELSLASIRLPPESTDT
jgi:hypothetical protein